MVSVSPIIQDGRLIGAVTHVLINDPSTGYGIFIENMLAPTPDTRKVIPNGQERITGAKTEFESAYGLIRAEWFYENGKFTYKVTIPDETEAKVEFPLLSGQNTVTINDLEFSESDGFKIVNGKMVFTLPAGEYIIK